MAFFIEIAKNASSKTLKKLNVKKNHTGARLKELSLTFNFLVIEHIPQQLEYECINKTGNLAIQFCFVLFCTAYFSTIELGSI